MTYWKHKRMVRGIQFGFIAYSEIKRMVRGIKLNLDFIAYSELKKMVHGIQFGFHRLLRIQKNGTRYTNTQNLELIDIQSATSVNILRPLKQGYAYLTTCCMNCLFSSIKVF